MKLKVFDVQNLLWLALALALAGSLKHLAAIFAGVDGNTFMGWLQAVAIDAGLFALAYSIRVRKTAKRSTKILWLGVAMFTTISIYGNLAYGLLATDGNLPDWLMVSRPYILAASLPVLVLFLAELLSEDRQYYAKVAEAEAKKAAKSPKLPPNQPDIATANEARIATKEQRKRQLATLHSQKPDATITELATLLDVSRGTVRNYASELGLELATNGNGQGAK